MTSRKPKRPAARVAGQAAERTPPTAAAKPGTPAIPVADVPGTSPPLPAEHQNGGGEARGLEAWKKAEAAHRRTQRRQRTKRPAPQITGVRVAQRPRGSGQ